jgi:hypothetical protein
LSEEPLVVLARSCPIVPELFPKEFFVLHVGVQLNAGVHLRSRGVRVVLPVWNVARLRQVQRFVRRRPVRQVASEEGSPLPAA